MPTLAEQVASSQNMTEQLLQNKQSPQLGGGLADLSTLPYQSRESALNPIDRARYGFADDWGKQQIIQQAGYTPDKIVRLKNGEYGIKTDFGVKPIDPKGFQLTDMAGDVAESLGKAIPTLGAGILGTAGIIGTPAGSVAGAAAGGLGGEALRQMIGEKVLKVRQSGLQGNDVMEMLGEGALAGVGQGMANIIGGQLSRIGAQKAATVAGSLSTAEIQPTALDAFTRFVGLPKGTNKRLLAEFIDPNGAIKYVPHEDAAHETIVRAANKAVSLVENGKNIIDNLYASNLAAKGINPATQMIDISNANNVLNQTIKNIRATDIAKQETGTISALLNIKKALAGKKQIPLSNLQTITSALNEVRAGTYGAGQTRITKMASRPLAAFTKAKNSIEAIAEVNAQYGPQIRAVKKLQNLFNIKLEEGLAKEGRFTPEMFIQRMATESKDRNLNAIIKSLDVLDSSGSPAFKDLNLKQDLLTGLFAKQLDAKAPYTGGRLSLSGITDAVGKTAFNPRRRAQMLKGAIESGVLDATKLETATGKGLPLLSAIINMAEKPNIPSGTLKAIGLAGKAISSKTGQAVMGQAAARSFNQILFGGK